MIKKIFKNAILLIISIIFFICLQNVFISPNDDKVYQQVRGIYAEKENSLDAVFIGSSTTYAFYSPLTAWKNYGIRSFCYSTSAVPIKAYRYMIDEARKTQPDAMYVLSITNDSLVNSMIADHALVDYMPFNLNKIRLIYELGGNFDERMELYIPMIRYHSRWNQLQAKDFRDVIDGTKAAMRYEDYLQTYTDHSGDFVSSDKKAVLETDYEECIIQLLDYCDRHEVKIALLLPPRMDGDINLYKAQNTLIDLFAQRGHLILDMRDQLTEMAIDLTQDYYDDVHTNIHGSIKYTDLVSRKLLAAGLKTEHETEDDSFDHAYALYEDTLHRNLLDFEIAFKKRDPELKAPQIRSANIENDAIALVWNEIYGADGYRIYRQTDDKEWQLMADTPKKEYRDEAITHEETYRYTVVAYRLKGGEPYYGHFDYRGTEIAY